MAQAFSEREVRMARSFIKAIKGNESNGYLLLAVITWQRFMARGSEAFFKSLSKYTAFEAGRRLAAKLAQKAKLDPKSYGAVLKTLRRGAKSSSATVTQARDFMIAISLSKWDKDKYGYKPYAAGKWVSYSIPVYPYYATKWVPEQQEEDPLAKAWAKLTGKTIPKQFFIDKVITVTKPPKPRPEPPRQPRSLLHVRERPDYLLPYAAAGFYEARRHLGDPANVLPV